MATKPWNYFACEEQAVWQWSWQSYLLTFRRTKKYNIGYNGNRNSLCDHLTHECQATQTWLKQKLGTKGQAKRLLFSLGVVGRCMGIEEKSQRRQPWAKGHPSIGPQGCHKYSQVQEIGGGKWGAERKTPAATGPPGGCARAGAEGCLMSAEGNHPAGALGFPTTASVPGVISPVHEVFPRPARKTLGNWTLTRLCAQKIFLL